MLGPIKVDETYIGGTSKNQHASKRDGERDIGGKYPVVGILDRATGEVRAESIIPVRQDYSFETAESIKQTNQQGLASRWDRFS